MIRFTRRSLIWFVERSCAKTLAILSEFFMPSEHQEELMNIWIRCRFTIKAVFLCSKIFQNFSVAQIFKVMGIDQVYR